MGVRRREKDVGVRTHPQDRLSFLNSPQNLGKLLAGEQQPYFEVHRTNPERGWCGERT